MSPALLLKLKSGVRHTAASFHVTYRNSTAITYALLVTKRICCTRYYSRIIYAFPEVTFTYLNVDRLCVVLLGYR